MAGLALGGNYSTAEEIRFVKTIGSWSISKRYNKKTPDELLENYIKAAKVRDRWGTILKDKVLEVAQSRLEEIRSASHPF